jgi:protein-disulfide isomerase
VIPTSSVAASAAAPAGGAALEPRTPTGEYFLGRADAPVTMEMFGDFQCPACGEFARTIEPPFIKSYVDTGKVKFVWHDYAWIGNESADAAQAARCAGEQGHFWAYHDYLYAHQRGENIGQFAPANLERFAQNVGLDMPAWNRCFEAADDLIDIQDRIRGGILKGVTVTPSYLINGELKIGAPPFNRLSALLDTYLARVTP